MRKRFEPQTQLGQTPIEKVAIPTGSRDELPEVLAGLQWLRRSSRPQPGATAHRVGNNVIARSLTLHYYSGATLRKSAEAIGMLGGIPLTPSALSQFTRKHCTGEGILAGIYQGLRREIATAPVVNTDDTGWRTGGRASYLMGFFTPQLAVFQVRKRHRSEEVREMLGEEFDAILGTDRGTSYEAKEFDLLNSGSKNA